MLVSPIESICSMWDYLIL